MAEAMGLQHARDTARAAARLARCDLASSTVMEMTALAGTMGRHYALKVGVKGGWGVCGRGAQRLKSETSNMPLYACICRDHGKALRAQGGCQREGGVCVGRVLNA